MERIALFKLFGFEVSIDLSWVSWPSSLPGRFQWGCFLSVTRGWSPQTYMIMGIVGATGLFFSIIFHEMSHSLVARRYGMTIEGITLFLFGGMAEMKKEPPNPKAEFMMAIAGPLSSIFLALVFYVLSHLIKNIGLSEAVYRVIGYLAWINAILAAFNLVPAFPLDGRRLLRSLLWGWKNNLRWATRIATEAGSGFGLFLLFLGIFHFLQGNFIGGMWLFFIGLFLRNSANLSYSQVLVRKVLEGKAVQRFMKQDPVTV